MAHSLQVWGIAPGEKMKKIVAVYHDEVKLAEQKKAELEKAGYRELVIQMTYTKQGGS